MKTKYKPRKQRKSFGLPIILSVLDSPIKLPARMNNFSEGGLSFNSNAHFPDGERLEIEVPYPKEAMFCDKPSPIFLKVKVIWSKHVEKADDPLIKYVHGCQFLEDPDGLIRQGVTLLMKLSEKLGQKPMGF